VQGAGAATSADDIASLVHALGGRLATAGNVAEDARLVLG
jgi:hypothetical protein